jgi:hypothetical protein
MKAAISREKKGHFVSVFLSNTEHGHLKHKINMIIVLFHGGAEPNFQSYPEPSEPGGARPL